MDLDPPAGALKGGVYEESAFPPHRKHVQCRNGWTLAPNTVNTYSSELRLMALGENAPSGTPLHTHVDLSGFHRTRRDQRSPHRHREARNSGGGGGLDVSTLTDNTTIVEDSKQYYAWRSFGPTDRRTEDLWVDLNKSPVQIHGILSNAHQKAAVR
ncbi:Plexin domain-containing protein 1 [Liparis tanakae]|uniref:Plexin domain-containing protein 1 n=1 Tax=Liparis tanakae TaxID=230148 RepID=A0A4Z2J546_9TELE|nr:Plexin domain-containing protein 1 [Liparis tanakae]